MRAGTVRYLLLALLSLTIPAWSQEEWSEKSDIDWEVSLSGGVFSKSSFSSETKPLDSVSLI